MFSNRNKSIFDKADFVQSNGRVPVRRVYGRRPVGNKPVQTQKINPEPEEIQESASQQNDVQDNDNGQHDTESYDTESMVVTPELYASYLPPDNEQNLLQNIPDMQTKYIDPILNEDKTDKFTADNIIRIKPYISQIVKEIIKYNVLTLSMLQPKIDENTTNIINDLTAVCIREMVQDAAIKIAKDIHIQRNSVFLQQSFQQRDFSNLNIDADTEELLQQINSITESETDKDKADYALFVQNNNNMNIIRNILLVMALTIAESYMEEWNCIVNQSE